MWQQEVNEQTEDHDHEGLLKDGYRSGPEHSAVYAFGSHAAEFLQTFEPVVPAPWRIFQGEKHQDDQENDQDDQERGADIVYEERRIKVK